MPEIALVPRDAAIPLLARGLSTDAVAQEVGVNGRTVRRWGDDPEFAAAVQAARRALLDEAVAALTHATRKAVDTLFSALDDTSASIRLRAASEIIRTLPALADHAALEARIEALESRLIEQENRRVRSIA